MTNRNIGYPLPPGDAFEDDLACMLVFYPNRVAYRQAFFSSLHGLGNWLMWQRDAAKGGRDAAQSWKLANELTRECFEMGYCDTMLDLLREIRDNTGVYCCDVVDISDGDQYTDAVEDGVGDVPQNIIDAGYATGVSDWAGFDDYKCMISHVMIDNMLAQAQKVQAIIDESGATLVTVAVLAAIAAAILTGGGAILAAGILLGIASVAGLYAAFAEVGEAGMPSLIDAMGEHHDTLACAIYDADGSANGVVALKDAIDGEFNVVQAAFLKSLNLSAQLKALYAGRYDQQDIAEIMADNDYDVLDYDCTCPFAAESYLATFDADEEEWTVNPTDSQWENVGNPAGGIYMHWALGTLDIPVSGIQLGAGLTPGADIEVVHVTLDYKMPNPISPDGVSVTFDPGDTAEEIIHNDAVEGSWVQLDFHPASPVLLTYNIAALAIVLDGGTGSSGKIDNVRVWFNEV